MRVLSLLFAGMLAMTSFLALTSPPPYVPPVARPMHLSNAPALRQDVPGWYCQWETSETPSGREIICYATAH